MTGFRILAGFFVGIALGLAGSYGYAQEDSLPLPRFASFKANEVNMRRGPGTQYEIIWIYRQKTLPVEIIQEFDTWRKIRDPEGTIGWVHKTMLSGKRTAIITGEQKTLRRNPDSQGEPKAYLAQGVIVTLDHCTADWCRVEAGGGISGWLARGDIWGIYFDEKLE